MFPWKCYISVKLCSVWFESFFNMSFCSFLVKLFYFFLLWLPVLIGILIDSTVYFAICRRLDDKMLKFWWKYHRFEHIEYATDTSWTQYMWRLILPSPISTFTMTGVLRMLSWPDFVMPINNQHNKISELLWHFNALFII